MKGSCLCQQVGYEVDALSGPIVHCHCRTCQKAHASAYASTCRVERDQFRWTRGESVVSAIESSPGKLRHFCSKCGSHLMAERIEMPFVILRVATLDEDPQLQPTRRIWRSHDLPWLQEADDIQSHNEAPAGR